MAQARTSAKRTEVLRSVSTKPTPPRARASIKIKNDPAERKPITEIFAGVARARRPAAARPAGPERRWLKTVETEAYTADSAEGAPAARSPLAAGLQAPIAAPR